MMKRTLSGRMTAAVCTLAMMLTFSVAAFAQINARVQGKAVDDKGNPIVGATVEMVDSSTGRKFTMKSDKKGEFLNIGVAPGKYDATLTKDGKVLDKATNYLVDPSKEVNELDFKQQGQGEAIAPAGAAGAGGAGAQQQAQQQPQKKMSKEEMEKLQKERAEVEAKNAKIKEYNAKVGDINKLLVQGRADIAAKNYPQATTELKQAVDMDPNQSITWGALGDAQLGAKQYKDCGQSFAKALELDKAQKPTEVAAWNNNLGACDAKGGDTQGAMAAFDKAAQADPTQAGQAYFNEGAVLTNLGKTQEANAAFDKAIAADPNRSEAYYQKGVNLLGQAKMNGTKMEAPAGTADAFQKYLELTPDGPNAANAKMFLEQMGEKVQTSYGKGKKK